MKRTLNHIARKFRRDTDGNIAIMSAVTVFALVAGLALAVDLSNAYFAKQRLQDTTDAVALMAAKDKSLDSEAKLQAAAQALYDATYPNNTGDRIVIENIQRDGDRVTVTTKNNIDTYFTGVLKSSNMDIGVSSSAVFADRAMDVALVLDTTFSMSSNNKIGNLKTAANGLLDTFEDLDNDKVRVSVVPFSQYVNVGLKRRNEIWLDVPADEKVCWKTRDVTSRSNCRRVQRTCDNDGVTYDCSYTKCDNTYGPEYEKCGTRSWKGCVGSRTAGYDERVAYNGRKIPGLLNVGCGVELQTLDSNMTRARSTVSSLKAQGQTYIPAGILWGWRTLDESIPLSANGANVAKQREKVMIVMTDGENQRSKNGERHDAKNVNNANSKTDTLCTQAKRDDVTIYTIAYDVSDSSTKNMLSRCASDNTKFFDARNASELNKAFKTIGDSLSELRITS